MSHGRGVVRYVPALEHNSNGIGPGAVRASTSGLMFATAGSPCVIP
ncbi:hypothetical protein SB659_03645 [Arthrobacter sp. SIMBA_036]